LSSMQRKVDLGERRGAEESEDDAEQEKRRAHPCERSYECGVRWGFRCEIVGL
jgi:hypothetical protein